MMIMSLTYINHYIPRANTLWDIFATWDNPLSHPILFLDPEALPDGDRSTTANRSPSSGHAWKGWLWGKKKVLRDAEVVACRTSSANPSKN